MSKLERLDRLCARLTATAKRMEEPGRAASPEDLTFVEAETTEICQGLGALSASAQAEAVEKLGDLADLLARCQSLIETRLAEVATASILPSTPSGRKTS